VNKTFSRTNFAYPRRKNGTSLTYWMVDLSEYELVCNYYTIRHDSSWNFYADWDFEVRAARSLVVWKGK